MPRIFTNSNPKRHTPVFHLSAFGARCFEGAYSPKKLLFTFFIPVYWSVSAGTFFFICLNGPFNFSAIPADIAVRLYLHFIHTTTNHWCSLHPLFCSFNCIFNFRQSNFIHFYQPPSNLLSYLMEFYKTTLSQPLDKFSRLRTERFTIRGLRVKTQIDF